MASGLSRRMRRLAVRRGSRSRVGLCWISQPPAPELGGRVVFDLTIARYGGCDVSEAVGVPRLARGDDDFGLIFAWDGRRIGSVSQERSGGHLLHYQWPRGLALSDPAAPPPDPPDPVVHGTPPPPPIFRDCD